MTNFSGAVGTASPGIPTVYRGELGTPSSCESTVLVDSDSNPPLRPNYLIGPVEDLVALGSLRVGRLRPEFDV